MNYETIKQLAKEHKCRTTDLIVLAPQNDPFYSGTPSQWRDAEWFKGIWQDAQYGNTDRVHLRRIHYRVVSLGTVSKPDGTVYENTEQDWLYLQCASKCARFLDLIDARCFEDRRNPNPILNHNDPDASTRVWKPAVSSFENDGYGYNHWFPDLNVEFDGSDADLGTAYAPTVQGYRYWDQRQPYLVEIWCEKSTMNDVLEPIASHYSCNIQTSLGFQSISSTLDLIARGAASHKRVRILYISDYDPAGALMPTAVSRQLEFWVSKYVPDLDIALKPIVLTCEQVQKYGLPRIPIKESDKRKARFEEREGQGCVELDALEALHPGELRKIITEEIKRLIDPNLWEKYNRAREQAEEMVQSEWEQATEDLRDDIESVKEGIDRLTSSYREKIAAIRDTYKEESEAIRERFKNLRHVIRDRAEDFSPDLPDLPEAEVVGDDPDEWLYYSARSYEEQLDFYKRLQGKARG